jgi:DNA-binding MarR family transcriptional regulator
MYRLIGDTHTVAGLPFAAQVFLRSLDGVRNRLATDAGLTGPELALLSRVAEELQITEQTVAEFMDISAGTAAADIDSLRQAGLLQRVEQPGEPEGPILELTASGHALMGEIYRDFQGAINDAAASLDDDRKFALDSAMLKMARKLNDSVPAEL